MQVYLQLKLIKGVTIPISKIVLGHLKSKFISQNYKETYITLYQTEYKVLTLHLKDYFEDKVHSSSIYKEPDKCCCCCWFSCFDLCIFKNILKPILFLYITEYMHMKSSASINLWKTDIARHEWMVLPSTFLCPIC